MANQVVIHIIHFCIFILLIPLLVYKKLFLFTVFVNLYHHSISSATLRGHCPLPLYWAIYLCHTIMTMRPFSSPTPWYSVPLTNDGTIFLCHSVRSFSPDILFDHFHLTNCGIIFSSHIMTHCRVIFLCHIIIPFPLLNNDAPFLCKTMPLSLDKQWCSFLLLNNDDPFLC